MTPHISGYANKFPECVIGFCTDFVYNKYNQFMPAYNLQVKQEGKIMMIRKAQMKDISRLAEIEVFGKRVAYRPIFQDDNGSFNMIQVGNIIEEYRRNPALLEHIQLHEGTI